MPVQVTEGATIITGASISMYRLLVLKRAMMFELKTGCKLMRGRSVFAVVKDEFGLKGSKQKVCEDFCAMLDSTLATPEPDGVQ